MLQASRKLAEPGAKPRNAREPRLQREGVDRIELAVEMGVQQEGGVVVGDEMGHVTVLGVLRASTASTRLRPRASRDITVPIGTPVTSAISR